MQNVKHPKLDKHIGSIMISGSDQKVSLDNHIDIGTKIYVKFKGFIIYVTITTVTNQHSYMGTITGFEIKTSKLEDISIGDTIFLLKENIVLINKLP